MLAEGRRLRAKVHNDVPDVPAYDANQLALGWIRLEMQSPERARNRMRVIVLAVRRRYAMALERRGVESLNEKSAAIPVDVLLNAKNAVERTAFDVHRRAPS